MISAGLPGDTLFGEMVISANGLSLLGGGWSIRLHRGNDGYADVIATLMSDDVIRIKTRVKYQGAWMSWQELANDYSIVNALREKAPGGFGLGETNGCPIDPSVEGGLNTAIKCGWYYFGGSGTIANAPSIPNGGYGSLLVTSRGADNTITQMCFFETYTTIAIRYRFGSEWQPWEYINPPMQLGVEYRTTERYLGKPVYCKVIDCGVITANTQKTVAQSIPVLDVLSCEGVIHTNTNGHNQATPFDYQLGNGTKYSVTVSAEAYNQSKADQLLIYVNSSWAVTGSVYAIVRYTKETD